MDILGTLKSISTLSKRVDDALAIKQNIEELQEKVSALVEHLQRLERMLKNFRGGKDA